ncbi:MAG: SPFH domain-containing protein [Victivallaceae bacterium]|nr:SPFH domain-containing protein [Victivallaceae bacterium]
MVDKQNLDREVDNSRLLTKLSVLGGSGALLLAILILILGISANFAGSDTFSLAVLPYTLAALFAFSAMIYGLMSTAAAQEEEEKLLLANRKQSSLLSIEEDVRFTAGRSFENYKRYAPYVLASLGVIILAAIVTGFYSAWNARPEGMKIIPPDANLSAFVAGIFMLISIFSGAFLIGQSRTKTFRWLQPLGAWLILGSVVLLAAGAATLVSARFLPQADYYTSRTVIVIYMVLGAEFIFNLVVEFYRPRTLEEPRPVFESRLLALFTEPGGVMRNIADTLDYQFGFKVSGTWIYRFLEKALFPLLIVWAMILWAFTCIQEVGPNEVGIRQRFGRIVSEKQLPPGVYLSLPYPFGKIARYSCSEIHQVLAGPEMTDPGGKKILPRIILWTKEHYGKEAKYLVAVKPNAAFAEAVAKETRRKAFSEEKYRLTPSNATPVSFLGASLPIQYRIKKEQLINFAYQYRDAAQILKNIGEMEVTRYFASVDFMSVMSYARHQASETLQARIQQAVDDIELGVEIIRVNLLDVHPPVGDVSQSFQKVIEALENRETRILEAKAYRASTLPVIQSQKANILAIAQAYQYRVKTVARAESERFGKQLKAFEIMPGIYKLRTYLDFLEKDTAEIRKFIVSASMPYQIYELNFEQKQRLDLIDADLGNITPK